MKDRVTRAVDIMIEQLEHPERFCSICRKRVGVCKHTRNKGRQ